MRLRLWHAPDGTRVAYHEAGHGPAIVLLHSCGLSHRELEPVVEHLADRFRIVLPDLPLHGKSEDRPRHPYSLDWFADVMSSFCVDVCGPQPLVGGHGMGAEILLHAATSGRLSPDKLILMPNRLHGRGSLPIARGAWRLAARTAAVPGLDRALAHATHAAVRPKAGLWLSANANPEAGDLVRHAFADVGGNARLARSWARFARRWPSAARHDLLERYAAVATPTLLLWAERDNLYPIEPAREALELLPDADLRVLADTGFLIAYDDAVGVAREIAAFVV
jgi:pimeloyl-ACP methyl ester carboxylesterase